jgi:rhamnose transport system permease protein
MINLLQQSLLRWLVISDFWVDALLGLLILVAAIIDALIINRLGSLWNEQGQKVKLADEKTTIKEESHAA